MTAPTSDLCALVATACLFTPGSEGRSVADIAQAGIPHDLPANLFAEMMKAGRGDLQAQRTLAAAALWQVLSGRSNTPFASLAEGLILARQAALQSESVDDRSLVASMLSLAVNYALPEDVAEIAGEAIAWVELVAESDAPHAEGASQFLAASAERENPEALQWAKYYRSCIIEAKETT